MMNDFEFMEKGQWKDEAFALVNTYCQHYIKHRLEMM